MIGSNRKKDRVFQPFITYKADIKVGWRKKQTVVTPLFSQYVFEDSEQAELYIPTFIDDMIKSGAIPKDAMTWEGDKPIVNTEILRTGVRELMAAALSLKKENPHKKQDEGNVPTIKRSDPPPIEGVF